MKKTEKAWGYSSWYRPGSWEDLEKARDVYYQSQSTWDLHLQSLPLQASTHLNYGSIVVRKLVGDPIEDIFGRLDWERLPVEVCDAIKYLLHATPQELLTDSIPPYSNIDYTVVGFGELRPLLFEKKVRARLVAQGGTPLMYMYCPGGDQCVFTYSPHVTIDQVVNCGVCGKPVDAGASAYACRLCILNLHKSCAERVPFKALRFSLELLLYLPIYNDYYHKLMPEKHACKSCLDGGKGFDGRCGSCNLETHLKCGILPTIMYHTSHPPHFLSLLLTRQEYRCRACGKETCDFSYCCKPCGLYYHLKCAFLPLQLLNHKHGGHQHVMKLLYSHHKTDEDPDEPEEFYWCDICGDNMDPHDWCYSCQDCPYYSTHLDCGRGYEYLQSNVRNAVFVPQIQSQLEAAMAEDNADSKLPANE